MVTEELQHALQRVSNTTFDAQGAANSWAGTTGLDLLGALNAKNGSTGLGLLKVLNQLAGTTGLDQNGAAALLSGVTPIVPETLRPNATLNNSPAWGITGAATVHQALADQSNLTFITGDSTPSMEACSVGFGDTAQAGPFTSVTVTFRASSSTGLFGAQIQLSSDALQLGSETPDLSAFQVPHDFVYGPWVGSFTAAQVNAFTLALDCFADVTDIAIAYEAWIDIS